MTGAGTVERIFTAPEPEVEITERSDVEAVAGSGLRGDRYFREIETGTFVEWEPDEERHDGYDLTLIEQEAVTAIEREAGIELAPGEHRETSKPVMSHSIISLDNDSEAVTRSVEGIGCVNPVTIFSVSLRTAYCRHSLTEEASERTFSKTG